MSKLESVARGDIKRLAVFMPPGAAKSTYCSILFPPWLFAQQPDLALIAASHTAELAEKWGRRVRNLIALHHHTLQVGLAMDNQAAGRWETSSGGEYFAAGVGGSITGRRADVVIIDDPVRSREDADSEIIRDRTFEWFKSDLLTRLKPGGRIVLVQTRWHFDDLAGRILEEAANGGEQWHVVSLPAEAEENDPLGRAPGEYLWDEPGGYNYGSFLRQEKAVQPARNWSALYMQRPAPETGNYFQDDWLKPYTTAPDRKTLVAYGSSDYAVTGGGGDYTCHVVVGIDPENRMYLLDLWRRQATSDVWIESQLDLIERWKVREWAAEAGQIHSAVGAFLNKRMQERQVFIVGKTFPSRHDKAVRAQSIRARMSIGGLYVPTKAPWFAAFRSELLSFPVGAHDDQVDALGLIGQLLDHMRKGSHPKPVDPNKNKPRWLGSGLTVDEFLKLCGNGEIRIKV